mgnify:CR=1 FL=1
MQLTSQNSRGRRSLSYLLTVAIRIGRLEESNLLNSYALPPMEFAMRFYLPAFGGLICTLGVCFFAVQAIGAEHPHVVLIMADDLGYGDVQPLNPVFSF